MAVKQDNTEALRLEKERINKDIEKMKAVLNKEMTIQDEDIRLSMSFKKIGDTIVVVRRGIMVLYGLSMSIKKSEYSLRELLQNKGVKLQAEIYNPEFSDLIKITNQVNELTKILPEEFKLSTEEAGEWQSMIADHKRLVNLLQNYTEYNTIKGVDYKKSLSQYVGDNIIKYSKLLAKENIDKQQMDQVNRKISAVLHELQKEYGKLYTKAKISVAAFESLREEYIKYVDVSQSIGRITQELTELKTTLAGQIEHVTKHLIAIQQITDLENDVKKNISTFKAIIDQEMYTLKDRQSPDKKDSILKSA